MAVPHKSCSYVASVLTDDNFLRILVDNEPIINTLIVSPNLLKIHYFNRKEIIAIARAHDR